MMHERRREVVADPSKEHFPHVRVYTMPREVYLGIIVKTVPEYHDFYSKLDWLHSRNLQHDRVENVMTMAALALPSKGQRLTEGGVVVRCGAPKEDGVIEVFARFRGPFRSGYAHGGEEVGLDAFDLLSCEWGNFGLRLRFLVHHPSYRDWSYFQQSEGYLVNRLTVPQVFKTSSSFSGDIHETLYLAHSMGYFDSPRRTTLREIALVRGVSHTMISRHLRTAERQLVANMLSLNWQDDG